MTTTYDELDQRRRDLERRAAANAEQPAEILKLKKPDCRSDPARSAPLRHCEDFRRRLVEIRGEQLAAVAEFAKNSARIESPTGSPQHLRRMDDSAM